MKRLDLPGKLRVAPGARVALAEKEAGRTLGWDEAEARAASAQLAAELGELQYQLYADGRFGLLVVLQGIDGAGKDGTVRHVFSAFNPQGCNVRAFKAPSVEELRHDYLWRVHPHVPARGELVVFNRSHYEDVLVPRVDKLVPRATWQARYAQINDFERMLAENGIHVLKLFLHISRAEQKERFEERIHERRKQWKLDPQDLVKRGQWSDYRAAYVDMLRLCSTKAAPWYVVPADHKWLRDLAVGQIVLDKLRALPLSFPEPRFDPKTLKVK
jgi:PPK2 family polyphosphate:nucleotide phosphotransferase